MPILRVGDYPAIRAAIDLSLDSTALPDETIRLSIYAGAAELEVKARDPDWASRTGDSLVLLTNAAIYLTAARIAPAIPRLLSEKLGGALDNYAVSFQAIDWAARVRELRALADAAFDALLGVPETDASDMLHSRHVTHRIVW